MEKYFTGIAGRALSCSLVLFLFLVLLPAYAFAQSGFSGNDVNFYYIEVGTAPPVRTIFRGWNTSADAVKEAVRLNDSTLAGQHNTIVACDVPNQNKTVIVTHAVDNAFAQVHNGTGEVGNNNTITFSTFPEAGRHKPISCGAEELNKSVVVMTSRGLSAPDIITIWDGTNFTMKNTAVRPSSTYETRQHWLASRKGSNEIAWWGDTVNNQTFVAVWNSTAQDFYDLTNLTAAGEGALGGAVLGHVAGILRNQTSSCSFESVSGRLLCFYGNHSDTSGSLYVFIRNATEQAVNPQAKEFLKFGITAANITNRVGYVNSIANPASNEILLIVGTGIGSGSNALPDSGNISLMVWNGSALGNFLQVEFNNGTIHTAGNVNYQLADAAYRYSSTNSTATEAVACWANTSLTRTKCRVWNGTTYSNEVLARGIGADPRQEFLSASINDLAGLGGYWAFLATADDTYDLSIQNFNSTAWGNLNGIETDLASSNAGRLLAANVWIRYDNTTPVFRSIGTNESDSAINATHSITINVTVRDNFQIDSAWIETNETGSFVNYTSGSRIWTNLTKSSFWQYFSVSWQNTSIAARTTAVGYSVCANDTNGNKACSTRQQFIVNNIPTQFSLKANHTADSANISITTLQSTLIKINCETNDTVSSVSVILQNSTDNVSYTNMTTNSNFPRANASDYSISDISGNSTQSLFNVSSNTARTFYLRAQCSSQSTQPRQANSTTYLGTSVILTVTHPPCISGQATPAVLCSNSCVTMNLAFRIGGDKNENIHTDSSDCVATNATTSGFSSMDNKFISAHRNSDVLGIAFAGSAFYHTFFDTNYSSAAYLLQLKQSADGNKFVIAFTNGTSATIDSAITQERDKVPSRTLGSLARSVSSSFPLYIRAEYDTIDINNRISWDGAVRIAIRNNGFINGLANITLSLLSGG